MQFVARIFRFAVGLLAVLYTSGYLLWRVLLLSPLYESFWQLQVTEVFWAWFYLPLIPLTCMVVITRHWRALLLLLLPITFFAWEYGAQFLPNWQHNWEAQALHAKAIDSEQSTEKKQLRVMTWNSFRTSRVADDLEAILVHDQPDIITIQEVSGGLRRQLKEYEAIYPYQVYQSYGTLITVSKFPLSEPPIDRLYQYGCRCLPLSVEWEGRSITIINTHIPRPTVYYRIRSGFPKIIRFNPEGQEMHFQVLFKLLEEINGPVILQGDMNTTERQPNFLKMKESLQDGFAEAGWGMGFTYPSANARAPWWMIPLVQIDHILHSDDLVTLSARVDTLRSSDHRYMTAIMQWQ